MRYVRWGCLLLMLALSLFLMVGAVLVMGYLLFFDFLCARPIPDSLAVIVILVTLAVLVGSLLFMLLRQEEERLMAWANGLSRPLPLPLCRARRPLASSRS